MIGINIGSFNSVIATHISPYKNNNFEIIKTENAERAFP